jgi:hypothetical protein
MAHVRTQIRHRVRDTLDAGLPATYLVAASRKARRNATPDDAHVNIRVLNDQGREIETQGSERIRVASVYIGVVRQGTGDALDDALDADEVIINDLIYSVSWDDLLEFLPMLMQVNFTESGEGEKDTSQIVLRYDMEYRVDYDDLETVVA